MAPRTKSQSKRPSSKEGLSLLLSGLKLPGFRGHFERLAEQAERDGWTHPDYLRQLCEVELEERRARRVTRLRRGSGLPPDKTLETLDQARLPEKVRRRLPSLCAGDFVDRGDNVLAFGLPGRGKTHLLAAIGHELVKLGKKVAFTPAYALVQRLLIAKKAIKLQEELRQLDYYDVVVIDDIGYVQQDREEMEVLFTFLSSRYERRSVMITSNLVFSQWDRIFKDPLTTAAAIDRVVHHSIILEMTGKSVRGEVAQQRNLGLDLGPDLEIAAEPIDIK